MRGRGAQPWETALSVGTYKGQLLVVQTQLGQSGREPKSISSTNTKVVGGAADDVAFAAFVDTDADADNGSENWQNQDIVG